MNCKISHPNKIIECEIDLPASKSISNRLLIIKALCKKNFNIEHLSDSDDTTILNQVLCSKNNILNVGAAGTSLRFLTSYLAIQEDKQFILTGTNRIKERPIKDLVKTLEFLGAEISYLEEHGFPPLKIKGKKLKGGDIYLNGNISSQFITSLLLIAPTLENGINLTIKGTLVSASYIKMTLKILFDFGIKSTWKDNIIKIKPQNYIARDYVVESDWSAASFWFEIAALSKSCKIKLNGLQQNSIQGDIKSIEIFKDLGVNSKFDNSSLILTNNKNIYKAKTYDLIENPDLFQPLSCTLFAKDKKRSFLGIETLKNKETDRIIAVINELVNIKNSKVINTYQDHRMAMSFAPLCLKFGEIQINNIQVVSKSYKKFWRDLKKAGFITNPLSD